MEQRKDRRSETRAIVDAPARVTILGEAEPPPSNGRILDISGRGILLRVPFPMKCGTPIKVEGADTLLLGDVCRCEPRDGEWLVAAQVRHRLDGLAELGRLNQALLGTETEAQRVPEIKQKK